MRESFSISPQETMNFGKEDYHRHSFVKFCYLAIEEFCNNFGRRNMRIVNVVISVFEV